MFAPLFLASVASFAVIAVVLVILIVLVISNVIIVPQASAYVIERLGAYQQTWGTGLHFKIPLIDRVANKVTLKERIADFPVTLPDGTPQIADIMAARIQTWGLPGIVPVVEATRGDGVEELDSTYLLIYPTLGNGLSIDPLQRNVTDQMKERPGGGVITVVIDATKEIPDSLIYLPESDGGFDATVNDWENKIEADITI